jgi:hypothetical protein
MDKFALYIWKGCDCFPINLIGYVGEINSFMGSNSIDEIRGFLGNEMSSTCDLLHLGLFSLVVIIDCA